MRKNNSEPDDWNSNWRSFIKAIDDQLQRGKSPDDIAATFENHRVLWSGVLVEKELHQRRGPPCVFVHMGDFAIKWDDRTFGADGLDLFFGSCAQRIVPWWYVPVGTEITFEAILSRRSSSKCIAFRYDSLIVETANDPILKHPLEYALKKEVSEELARAVHPEPIVSETWSPPEVSVSRSRGNCLKWTRVKVGESTVATARLPQRAPVHAGLVQFWETVLSECPEEPGWHVILITAQPENGTLTVQFCTQDLLREYPLQFAFNAGRLSETLSGEPSPPELRAQAVDFYDRFWNLVHIALCSASKLSKPQQLRPDTLVLACEHDDPRYIQLQLPR